MEQLGRLVGSPMEAQLSHNVKGTIIGSSKLLMRLRLHR